MFHPPALLGRASHRLSYPIRTAARTSRFSPPNITSRIRHPTTQFRRHASTEATVNSFGTRVYNFFYGTTLVLGLGIIYFYVTDTRASIHKWLVIPVLRTIYTDPEEAHEVGNRSLERLYAFGLHPRERGDPDKKGDLEVEVFGHTLKNPIGTSAGIDKHADIPDPLLAIGPSIIELGGTTPLPQSGNAKPRVFRLTSQNALINRYGLNSEGADHIAQRLRQRVRHFAEACGFGHDAQGETLVLDGYAGVPPGSLTPGKLLAVNIAKNKATPENDIDAVTKDYLYCAERLAPYADILVVNVSSPNTPGLRSLQNQEALTQILSSVVKAARSVQRTTKPAVMVKVSPDEDSDEQVQGICQAIWAADVDGIVVGNTTNKRPEALKHLPPLSTAEEQHLLETGGFSGPHLFEKTVSMVKKYKKFLGDKPPASSATKSSSSPVNAAIERAEGDLKTLSDKLGPRGDKVTDSIQTGSIPPKNVADKPDSEKQSLFQLPTDRFYDESKEEQDKLKTSPEGETQPASKKPQIPTQTDLDLKRRDQPKVIFATGGITTGKQAQEILDAGASVAMVYTALVYGGVGTISRIKDELRNERAAKANKSKKPKRPKVVTPAGT